MDTITQSKGIRFLTLLFLLFAFASCSTISTYDQQAYSQTISAKVDALQIMDLATSDYATYEEEAKALQTQLLKCKEYAAHRPKNKITTEMWTILIDEEGHLIGGFIKRWENEDQLNPIFVTETKKLVGKAFDEIAELESKKINDKNQTLWQILILILFSTP
jgi:hypothetical protein